MRKSKFRFRGHFERYQDEVWAVCDHAPVYAAAENEEAALERMKGALGAYVEALFARHEVEVAVRGGRLVRAPGEQAGTRQEDEGRFVAVIADAA